MEYIIIFLSDTKAHWLMPSDHGFIEKYCSYADAKQAAEAEGEKNYSIYALCTDKRNHVI